MKEKDITFHYTKKEMVDELLKITPLSGRILDAGSGKNKVWYKGILDLKKKYGDIEKVFECELEDNCDFLLDWNKQVDWVVGNPPFHISWKFTEKALDVANKGIAWLVNNQALNSHFTPARLEKMQNKGFYLQKIKVVCDKRWFGRYYYLIFTKEKNDFILWEKKVF